MLSRTFVVVVVAIGSMTASRACRADVAVFGDMDVLGTGSYAEDPLAGATLEGLSADTVTFADLITPHGYPFSPSDDDHLGTDQIYVGQVQLNQHDGYSSVEGRLNGPQVLTLDYSALVPQGQSIATLTLGIAADDFQFPAYQQPFIATVNGLANPALTETLNSIDLGGPAVQFLTIGIDPLALADSHILTLTIDQGGDGGDGWAVDYLTVGVTLVPAPGMSAMLPLAALLLRRRR